jgi:hypothetical protein
MDNAPDNDTILQEIFRWLLATYSIIWDADKHKLRCFGYVVSLIANVFTEKLLKAARIIRVPNTPKTLKTDKLV